MNERTEALAKQAAEYAIEFATQDQELYIPKLMEKFAELIVQECMLQCIKVENDVELSDYEGGFKDGALLCYQKIQEHFGVENEIRY